MATDIRVTLLKSGNRQNSVNECVQYLQIILLHLLLTPVGLQLLSRFLSLTSIALTARRIPPYLGPQTQWQHLLFYTRFAYVVYALSISTNLLLINITSTAPNKEQIGSYRFLLNTLAIVDILISTVHALLAPRVLGTSFGYIFYGQTLMGRGEAWGKYGGHVLVLLLYLTFLALVFQYIYRAQALSGLNIGEGRKGILLPIVILATFIYSSACIGAVEIGFRPTSLKRELYRPYLLNETGIDLLEAPMPGFLAVVFRVPECGGFSCWRSDALLSIGIAFAIFSVGTVVIGVCTYHILRDVRSIPAWAPEKKMQKQLFRALVVQTVVACLFYCLPLSIVFLLPVFGRPLGGLSADLLIMVTAIAPAVNPILIIAIVGRYRKHVLASLARLFQ